MAHYVKWKGELPHDGLFRPVQTHRSKTLIKLVARVGDICAYCGCKTFLPWELKPGSPKKFRATLDHEPPRHAQPFPRRRKLQGLVLACYGCNNAKGALDAVTFKRLRTDGKALAEAKRKLNAEIERKLKAAP